MVYFYYGPPNWGFLDVRIRWLFSYHNPPSRGISRRGIPGPCLYMIWTALACMVFFVDSIVWSGNIIDWSPAWCDLSTHFLNGFNLAIPACSLCINRRLYQIASVRTVTKTASDKRRAILIDLAIGLGLPLLQIPLQYIVQTPVAIVLFHLPPILVGCVSAVYCVLSIKSFYHSRAQFKELLSSNKNLNLNRYVRLMCLASTDLMFTIPLAIWTLWPVDLWADTHSNFSRVVSVPGIFWRTEPYTVASLETTRWATIACALLFFGYFGFADEAIKNYRTAFNSVAKRMGYSTATMSSSGVLSSGSNSKYPPMNSHGRTATLPVFIRKETAQKRDSFDSFSDMSASFGALDYVDKRSPSPAPVPPRPSAPSPSATSAACSPTTRRATIPPTPPPDLVGVRRAPQRRGHTPPRRTRSNLLLHRSSAYIVPPEPAHTRTGAAPDVPLPIHPHATDAADIV
ncbi:pheromone A receptor-domain-containing protein [Mycena alexandri]|uniref:Pheromone A receptor-domain-containing protein n=1 Tax=Mycena alexandri TaxID=1745969 RepID=A0AAD6S2N5_9AGAR|nr:pheromone A receptor-domain-containing protein [Mycena alexandri]